MRISPGARESLKRLADATVARDFIAGIFDLVPKLTRVHVVAFGYRAIGYRATTVIHSDGARFTSARAPSIVIGNPADDYVEENPRIPVGKISDFLPRGAALARHPFYREVMRPGGWRYGINFAFWEPDPASRDLTAFVAALRTARQGDFSAEDVAVFEALHPEVEAVLRRVVAAEVVGEAERGLRTTIRKLPVPVVVARPDGEVVVMSRVAEGELARWWGGGEAVARLPDVLRREVEALRVGGETRLVRGSGGWLARVSWLPGSAGELVRVSFLAEAPAGLPVVNLSADERRLVERILQGRTDREIAVLLDVNVSKVKADLRALYARHRVRSRTELLVALG